MTSDNQSSKSDNIFVQYRKPLISVLILVGSIGFFTGEEKSIKKSETVPGACLILRSYESSGIKRGAGKFLRQEDCKLDYGKIQNPEKFLRKTNSTNYVLSRDLVAEGQSRLVRFFSFGIFAALATAVFLTLRAKGDFKERTLNVKKSFRIKLESGKSKTNVRKAGLLNSFEKRGDDVPTHFQRTANRYAQVTSSLAAFLLVLGFIGSILIAFNPEEKCETILSSEYCEKDWFTSIVKALVGFFLTSLTMLSVLTIVTYIQWRTSRLED